VTRTLPASGDSSSQPRATAKASTSASAGHFTITPTGHHMASERPRRTASQSRWSLRTMASARSRRVARRAATGPAPLVRVHPGPQLCEAYRPPASGNVIAWPLARSRTTARPRGPRWEAGRLAAPRPRVRFHRQRGPVDRSQASVVRLLMQRVGRRHRIGCVLKLTRASWLSKLERHALAGC